MEKSYVVVLVFSVFFFLPLFHGGLAMAATTQDGSEQWGYVQVRPKAHMFWWYYRSPYKVEDPNKPWPIILWLQGGPGASGVGIGNFQEVGPLDTNLKSRNSTWLTVADLLFVRWTLYPLTASELSMEISMKRYSRYLDSLSSSPGGGGDLGSLMNGVIRKKLRIIPKNVQRIEQSDPFFTSIAGDFMRPRISELDVICATKGTEAWLKKLKCEGPKTFLSMDRTPVYCGGDKVAKAFTKSYRNLHFNWILGAGHFVTQNKL